MKEHFLALVLAEQEAAEAAAEALVARVEAAPAGAALLAEARDGWMRLYEEFKVRAACVVSGVCGVLAGMQWFESSCVETTHATHDTQRTQAQSLEQQRKVWQLERRPAWDIEVRARTYIIRDPAPQIAFDLAALRSRVKADLLAGATATAAAAAAAAGQQSRTE